MTTVKLFRTRWMSNITQPLLTQQNKTKQAGNNRLLTALSQHINANELSWREYILDQWVKNHVK